MEYSRRQRTFHSISMDGARTPGLDLQIHPNVPISSTLLTPIKKALNSAGFLTFANGILRRPIHWDGVLSIWGSPTPLILSRTCSL